MASKKEMLLKARVEAAENELNRKQVRIDEANGGVKKEVEKRLMGIGEGVRTRTRKRSGKTSCTFLEKSAKAKMQKWTEILKHIRTLKAESMIGESISDIDL